LTPFLPYDKNAKNGPSLAIGYGFDLLVRDNAEINTYLVGIGLSPLSTQDAQLLNQARARYNAHTTTQAYLNSIRVQLILDLGSESTATQLLNKYISLKTEMVYFEDFRSLEEGMRKLKGYIGHYNHERLHSSLGYRSPAQFEAAHG